jgi:hypothetical protein
VALNKHVAMIEQLTGASGKPTDGLAACCCKIIDHGRDGGGARAYVQCVVCCVCCVLRDGCCVELHAHTGVVILAFFLSFYFSRYDHGRDDGRPRAYI